MLLFDYFYGKKGDFRLCSAKNIKEIAMPKRI